MSVPATDDVCMGPESGTSGLRASVEVTLSSEPVAAAPLESDWRDQVWLTVRETARVLRMGRSSTYTAVNLGYLPSVRIGSSIRIPTAELRRLLGEIQ